MKNSEESEGGTEIVIHACLSPSIQSRFFDTMTLSRTVLPYALKDENSPSGTHFQS
jgi:hypothetical protein